MTDSYAGFVVTLDKDLRSDEAQAVIGAIEMIKGVITVGPVAGHSLEGQLAEQRVRSLLTRQILDVLVPPKPPQKGPQLR